jgi:isopenicillin N synthase-like dioxygenase
MTVATARAVDVATLPVIDIAGLRSPAEADRRRVAAAMRAACLDKGFFYISGHGVPVQQTEAVFDAARRFFDLPAADKQALDLKNSKASHGYEPLQAQVLEAGTPPDLKEGFYIGFDLPADHPRILSGEYKQGPNQWPAGVAGFRETMNAYHAQMTELGRLLMRGLALSLDLDEDHFATFCDNPLARLRLLHYPPQPARALPGQKGVGAHTDFGGLTILLQDSCGGLQVFDRDSGDWIHAAPVEGAYVVNLGDLIARWTNERYRSTLHRVVNLSGRERYSIPFFFHGNPNHLVECLPNCLEAGAQPKYPPATVREHFEERYQASYRKPQPLPDRKETVS